MSPQATTIRFGGQDFPPETKVIDLVNVRPVTLAPLGDLPNLQELRLHHTDPHSAPGGALLDLSVLRRCPALTTVEIPKQNVRSLDGLDGHQALLTVDVSFTRVADLAPLAGLPSLTVLRLRHTQVGSVEPLASVLTLEELDIAHSRVADISALTRLPALGSLDLRASRVTDVGVLADMPALRKVVVQRLEVDRSAVERLRDSRPDIEIVSDR